MESGAGETQALPVQEVPGLPEAQGIGRQGRWSPPVPLQTWLDLTWKQSSITPIILYNLVPLLEACEVHLALTLLQQL